MNIHPKSDARYWAREGRLFTQPDKKDFCCRFSHNGRRGFFDLNTPNKVEAQKLAAERYKFVVAHGWDSAAKNPEFRVQVKEPKEQVLTVGGWISAVNTVKKGMFREITFLSYKQALRRLSSEAVLGLDHDPKKHAAWLEKVDAVPLSKITGDVIARWISHRLGQAKGNHLIEEKMKHTVNHVLRSAKALFSRKKVLPKLSAELKALLPHPFPFEDTSLLKEDSSGRFTPTIDPERLLALAFHELGSAQKVAEADEAFEAREQQWIAFLLCFCAGLRRREADLLEWTQVYLNDVESASVELKTTEHFRAKNAAHAKAVRLDPEVADLLQSYKRKCVGSKFVLLSERPCQASGLGAPRCRHTWSELTTWLRKMGLNDAKPVHALRKSMGALMADKHGIHHAQRHLRHTSPTITSKYYSSNKSEKTPGIGHLLALGSVSEGE